MFGDDKQMDAVLTHLKGNVEWLHANDTSVRGGLEILARVDGELRGIGIWQETWGGIHYVRDGYARVAPSDGSERWRMELLDRKRTLVLAYWLETGGHMTLMNAAERAEFEKQSAMEEERAAQRKRAQAVEEERREREQLAELKRKYEGLKKNEIHGQ